MAKLTLEEARNLVQVFGEVDPYKGVLLLLLTRTTSKWDLRPKMKMLPKNYRVPQATLYRRVNELSKNFFLDTVYGKTGRAGMTVNSYRLSMKGILAAGIYAYALFLDAQIPTSVKEKSNVEQWIKTLESSLGPAWELYINFLRWHRERRIDLSEAKIDMAYFGTVVFLSMLDHPENVTEDRMRELAEPLIKLGMALPANPKDVPALLENAKKALQELGGSFLFALLDKTKDLDSNSLVVKEAES
jgi:hypothetical protein